MWGQMADGKKIGIFFVFADCGRGQKLCLMSIQLFLSPDSVHKTRKHMEHNFIVMYNIILKIFGKRD